MATTGVINTKLLKILVSADAGTPSAVTCQTDAKLTITNGTRQTTCKDSGQWEEYLYAMTSATLSGSALASEDGTYSFNELSALAIAQTKVDWVYGTSVVGDTKYSGEGILTSWSLNSPGQNENVTVDYEIQVTGAITAGVFA